MKGVIKLKKDKDILNILLITVGWMAAVLVAGVFFRGWSAVIIVTLITVAIIQSMRLHDLKEDMQKQHRKDMKKAVDGINGAIKYCRKG
jgi:Flp pilus assembly protein TadB